jgi:hypothetical protein
LRDAVFGALAWALPLRDCDWLVRRLVPRDWVPRDCGRVLDWDRVLL